VAQPGLLKHVSGVEVGNEMDLYFHEKAGRAPHRTKAYTEAQYEEEFAAFVAAYEAAGLPKHLIQVFPY